MENQIDKNFTNEELDIFLNEIKLLVDDYLNRAKLHALDCIKTQLVNTPTFNVDNKIAPSVSVVPSDKIVIRGKRGRGRPKKTN